MEWEMTSVTILGELKSEATRQTARRCQPPIH